MNKVRWFVIIFSLLLWPYGLIFGRPVEKPRSIFIYDYQAQQTILRNTYLYPSVIFARVFQNKLNIPIHKFENDFFSLIDPNNYFFGSHPREIPDRYNPVKIPFIAIIFFLYGLLNIKKIKHSRELGFLFISLIIILSFIQNFDQYDIVLWPIFCLIIVHGYRRLLSRHFALANIFLFFLSFVSLAEYLRLTIIK